MIRLPLIVRHLDRPAEQLRLLRVDDDHELPAPASVFETSPRSRSGAPDHDGAT